MQDDAKQHYMLVFDVGYGHRETLMFKASTTEVVDEAVNRFANSDHGSDLMSDYETLEAFFAEQCPDRLPFEVYKVSPVALNPDDVAKAWFEN